MFTPIIFKYLPSESRFPAVWQGKKGGMGGRAYGMMATDLVFEFGGRPQPDRHGRRVPRDR